MAKILLADDDKSLASAVADLLKIEHHVIDQAHDGDDALHMLLSLQYDTAIIDWDMPRKSGVEVIAAYRASGGGTPILLLTGKDSYTDKELGLDSGADDYLTKPFHPKELTARVRALLRRAPLAVSTVLIAGDLALDPVQFQLTKNGVEIQLARMEFALLEFFLRHPNEVFSPTAILDRVWPADSERSPESLRVVIKKLRDKIDDPDHTYIKNVHGVGYKLERRKP